MTEAIARAAGSKYGGTRKEETLIDKIECGVPPTLEQSLAARSIFSGELHSWAGDRLKRLSVLTETASQVTRLVEYMQRALKGEVYHPGEVQVTLLLMGRGRRVDWMVSRLRCSKDTRNQRTYVEATQAEWRIATASPEAKAPWRFGSRPIERLIRCSVSSR